jgi:hypothetical protein
MKPLYRDVNDKGQWWDGRVWRNPAPTDHLVWLEKYAVHDAANCHVDGCFKCPRCRLMHFVPDNFDLLCDGCCNAVLAHPQATQEQIDGIRQWKRMAAEHWRRGGVRSELIQARVDLRERLTRQRTQE